MRVIINMNEKVKVKLSEHGRMVLLNNYKKYSVGSKIEYEMPKQDKDGYCEFQLWELFQDFGEHIGMGFKNCFDNDIVFER